MTRPRLATLWLDGCSGCHMSFLDMDERILELAARAELVYSPLVDAKQFPEAVDITLVEGAISTDEDLHKIRVVRSRTRCLVSFGDCAGTGNVPAMRNVVELDELALRAYPETARAAAPGLPSHEQLPRLLSRVRAVHEVVPVDLVLPGCPPAAELINRVLSELLDGATPDLSDVGFG